MSKIDLMAQLAQCLPNSKTTKEGPVIVLRKKTIYYRFHLRRIKGITKWVEVPASGEQRCAYQTCSNTFYIAPDSGFATYNKLYCSNSCRGRASELRQVSNKTMSFDGVDDILKVNAGNQKKTAVLRPLPLEVKVSRKGRVTKAEPDDWCF